MLVTTAVYLLVNRFFPSEVIQRTAINKWLGEHKIAHSSVQWFIDREAKTEFQQLTDDIKNGAIKTFVIFSLEQAFPSIASITAAIGDFASKNMEFISVSQGISFNQESIKSATALLTVVLNLADHHKRVRQQQGIEKARDKGLYKGKKPGTTKPGFEPKKILVWRKRGWTAKRIATKLGVAESTVFRYMRILREK
jgi:DNA invertase Pin-like site-specific DNA recombinase